MLTNALLLAGGLVVQSGGPATPACAADALSQAYFEFLQARDLDARDETRLAIAGYRKAVDLCPRAADIHAELASVLARDDQTDAAVKEAGAALALDPANQAAHRVLGLIQSELLADLQDAPRAAAMRRDAIGHLEVVVAERLVDPTVELALGRLYVQDSQYDKAIDLLRLFLLDRPGSADAMLLLASAYEHTHDYASAIDMLQGASAAQPRQPRIATWLAEMNEQAGRWKDAAAVWGRLADASPQNLSYRTREASALVSGGDAAAGRQVLVAVTERSPRDVAVWYLLAEVDRRAGDLERAEDDARKIGEIDAADPRGPLALAAVKSAGGDHRAAAGVLEPFVRSPRPADVESGYYARMAAELASALDEMGDRSRAVAVLEDARRRDAHNPDLLFELGTQYEHAKRFDRAEQMFRDVIASEPANADALNFLGYMLADRGTKLDEAVTLITRALAIDADNPSFLDSLGWAYVKQEKFDRARDPLQRAAAALPKTSVIQDHLAELYFHLKQYQDAASAWDRALDGDRSGIDVPAVTKKRDRAKALAGK